MKLTPGINKIVIDGSGELTLTRNDKPFHLDMSQETNIQATVQHFYIVGLTRSTRIGRFLQAMKYVWAYCK